MQSKEIASLLTDLDSAVVASLCSTTPEVVPLPLPLPILIDPELIDRAARELPVAGYLALLGSLMTIGLLGAVGVASILGGM